MTPDELVLSVILPLLIFAGLLAVVRLALGPTLPDRVVALDFLALILIGAAAAYAIATDQKAFLYAAVVLALISFIGTVAFAYFLRREEVE